MTSLEFEHAWLDIYLMLEDNAFDYVNKPFFIDDANAVIVNGTTYYANPF